MNLRLSSLYVTMLKRESRSKGQKKGNVIEWEKSDAYREVSFVEINFHVVVLATLYTYS